MAALDSDVVGLERRDLGRAKGDESIVNGNVARARELADAAMLELSLTHVVQGEHAGQVERVKALQNQRRRRSCARSGEGAVSNALA